MERSEATSTAAAAPVSAPPVSSRFEKWATALLLLVGVEFWLVLGEGNYGSTRQLRFLLGTLLLSCIPPITRNFSRFLNRLRQPTIATRATIWFAATTLSTFYFILTAHHQGRSMTLKYVDEHSYAIGMQMAAHGRLWMPQHPAADFFEALQLLVRPAYASIYFPGTAILYAPTVWLGIRYWILSAILGGLCVGLTYRVVAELVDSVSGILCALILTGTSIFRLTSVMLLSQAPALLMALLTIYAWLRWRNRSSPRWALAMGVFAGWCFITRPYDAIALLLPVGAAAVVDLRSEHSRVVSTIACAAAGAMPFMVIQIVFNMAITGSWYRTPFQLSQLRDYPQTELGFHVFDPSVQPETTLPQKLVHYERTVVPAARTHEPRTALRDYFTDWLPNLLERGLPQQFMLILLPCGWLAFRRRRWVLIIVPVLWSAAYVFYVFRYPHYIVVALPFIAATIVCGAEQISRTWPVLRHALAFFFTMSIAILSVTGMPEFDHRIRDEWFNYSELTRIDQAISEIPQPAVVLFTYDASDPLSSGEVEPVYNTDVAWPDDAHVIRAHDLGPKRNAEIFNYYARQSPQRAFYIYDRGDNTMKFLGLARDLATDHAN